MNPSHFMRQSLGAIHEKSGQTLDKGINAY